ncbi:type II toxin-antitoxin system Phd/YefM family antitoxin [Myxococcota bacterium]|nr:type II toxin-antitoxin system Phd/YefM family antitoxin [Myxococcota bacterium]
MSQPRFSEDVHPLKDLKTGASSLVDQVRKSGRPVLITRRGRGVAVLLDLEEYERLTDRATFVEAVMQGVESMEEDRLYPNEEAEKILDTFGEPDDQ